MKYKYTRKEKENKSNFVARIINEENRAMNAKEVTRLIDKRTEKAKTKGRWQASCSDAVRLGLIAKTKPKGGRVLYHPLSIHPQGDDIPIPKFKKCTTNIGEVADALKNKLKVKHEPNAINDFNKTVMRKIGSEFRPIDFNKVADGLKKLEESLDQPPTHDDSWIDVAARHYQVSVKEIERIVLYKLYALDEKDSPIIDLRDVLHKGFVR